MKRLHKIVLAATLALVVVPTAAAGRMYWQLSHPAVVNLALPATEIALDSPEGAALLAGSPARADADALLGALQTQEKGSWCGVASAVTVLDARGAHLTQEDFFTPEASAVRSWWDTTFGGMPLPALAGMMSAHGVTTEVHHAESETVDSFRQAVATNLATPGDWLIVNYDRRKVDESGGGHISPLAAYDPQRDMVLLLDVSTYKYPPHWVSVAPLFDAMNTVDSESGRSRGWVGVR